MKFALIVLIAIAGTAPTDAQEPQSRTRRRLRDNTVIDGITCAPTGRAYAEFHPSGRLAECPLASDTVLFDQEFPARTWVGFTDDGKLRTAWLVRDTELSGVVCKGVGYKGYSVRFYPSGALELCFLAADTTIDGIPCLHGSFWTELRGGGKSVVMLRDNGRLRQCQAAADFTRDGREVRRWQVVTLDEAGRVRQ